jgi:uncharacterized membrane protein SpoIIM required for sporulation
VGVHRPTDESRTGSRIREITTLLRRAATTRLPVDHDTTRHVLHPEDPSRRHWRIRTLARLPLSAFDSDADVDISVPRPWWPTWLVIGFLAALVGQGAGWWFFRGHDTFNGALLFTLCALAGLIYPVFQRNSKEIWSGQVAPGLANLWLMRDMGLLFAGILTGFLAASAAIGANAYQAEFPAGGTLIDLRRLAWTTFDFAPLKDILANNLRVFLVFLLVGLTFRYVGILFIVIVNAAHWGVVLGAAAGGTLQYGHGGWLDAAMLLLVITPHLALELAAYVLAGMTGIFLNRGLMRYTITSRHFTTVATASLQIAVLGAALVICAAFAEILLGGTVGGWYQSQGQQVMP